MAIPACFTSSKVYPKPRYIKWPAIESLHLPEIEIIIPNDLLGRVEVYKVPVSDKYPWGYFVVMNTNTDPWNHIEPGYMDSVRLADITVDTRLREPDGEDATVINYLDSNIVLDKAALGV